MATNGIGLLGKSAWVWLLVFSLAGSVQLNGQPAHTGYRAPESHRAASSDVIEIDRPGYYADSGVTYMLTRDISSAQSTLFLGKDVTIDLNGFTLSYAAGPYEHIPNSGFEAGLVGWDVSNAPGAKVVGTKDVHIFVGDSLLSLEQGDELVSPYINLPVADRSYYAMCGVTGRYYQDMEGNLANDMKVSVFVEDEQGNPVRCVTRYADTTLVSCPVEQKSPRLGGGFVVAHLTGLPAGRYRVRVRADTDCLVDEIDIRPSMDVGIGIVAETHPYGHYDHLYEGLHSAFFDYTSDVSELTPLPGIPVVKGEGTVTIKNGIIKNGTVGVASWGVQSTAEGVKVVLDNVKFESSGINATAVDVPHAEITQCTFAIDNPFIINRHGSQSYAVDLRGKRASAVSYSEFYGGQGCLVIKGSHSSIHHNYFVNRQTVTNHYSVMAMGDSAIIFENRFEPEVGSGIEIFRHRGIAIFNNYFKIEAAPPTCEYHLSYSTNAIRIADYGARKNAPDGAYGNKIYNNEFTIIGRKYHDFPAYTPLVSAIFYSASAGHNQVFGNKITVQQHDPGTDALAYAFYIGNSDGGTFDNNHILSDVTPVWIATMYGDAVHTELSRNRIGKLPGTHTNFIPVRMGYAHGKRRADKIKFCSNELTDLPFGVSLEGSGPSTYSVSWTYELSTVDGRDNAVAGKAVKILDSGGKEVFTGITDETGKLSVELPEYSASNGEKAYYTPYTLLIGDQKHTFTLTRNTQNNYVVE